MEQQQFNALMPYICTDLVTMIVTKQNISDEEAITMLYCSKLYEMLEDEETKLWHYSTEMLYSLLMQEITTGCIIFPDV